MNWTFEKKEVRGLEDMPEGTVGFVYMVGIGGYHYIGKKYVKSTRKKHFGKKKLATITDKRLKTYEMITKESDWQTYNTSSSDIVALMNQGHTFDYKDILYFASSKRMLTYLEVKSMFEWSVLEQPNFLNSNILGKFFKGIR